MEAEYLEDARSAYEYLRWSSGNKSSFFEEFLDSKIAKSFYDSNDYSNRIRSFHYSNDLEDQAIDISSYRQLQLISQQQNDSYDKELSSFFAGLDETKSSEYEEDHLEYETADGNKIIFKYISFDFDEDENEILDLYWDGILLIR